MLMFGQFYHFSTGPNLLHWAASNVNDEDSR